MKFMGIPIDGKIEAFNSKVISKGFKPDASHNAKKVAPYWYEGSFAGYRCDMYVYFSNHSRIVYDVSVCIDDYGNVLNKLKLSDFVEAFKLKYENKYFYEYEEDDYTFEIKRYPKDKEYDENRMIGSVEFYIEEGSGDYEKNNYLWIVFKDYMNKNKNESDKDLDI